MTVSLSLDVQDSRLAAQPLVAEARVILTVSLSLDVQDSRLAAQPLVAETTSRERVSGESRRSS